MRDAPQHALLADGRLHLQHGPIDLIIETFGADVEIIKAHRAAIRRFDPVLGELCSELEALRRQARPGLSVVSGPVARRMEAAVVPFAADHFITPMAAVAGAVADAILAAMAEAATLEKAYVNNGGDIALLLSPTARFSAAMIGDPGKGEVVGIARIDGRSPVRGIATSGRHGRSFSRGIADAVTVLAQSAAEADAAATIIANAVDLPGHPAVTRQQACDLDPQSDLGNRLVTIALGPLRRSEIEDALANGLAMAEHLKRSGLIEAASLHLSGTTLATDASTDRPFRLQEAAIHA
ncbi:MAG: UPF0280 family protein [Beijerinckiaceae bacterium]|nr:UPF0280 family protein [Beijerinckiaceae bacterium]